MNTFFISKTYVIKFAFSALLIFIHFLYSFYTWLVNQTIFKEPDPWRDRSVDEFNKYRLIKKPKHLVVSVCQEEVFYEYLAKLLAWALFLEVPVVSFYHNENGKNIILWYLLLSYHLPQVFGSTMLNMYPLSGKNETLIDRMTLQTWTKYAEFVFIASTQTTNTNTLQWWVLNNNFINLFPGISPEELFFALRDQYSGLLTKINWGLEFNNDIKLESKKCINGKYFYMIIMFWT